MNNLVIVESPAKAKTIEKYLGSDFKVLSSVGHIRSIAKKPKKGLKAIDTANNFKTIYEIDPDKKKVITGLKKAVKEAKEVWLATDEDREGEAIAWHLAEVLGLDIENSKRIVFHEITKPAIENAIKNPRKIDMKLVEAQQARQILDRLVGFELSPVVWQKVPGGKSAGRVQSPAVRLLVERENEIRKFSKTFDFKLTAELAKDTHKFSSELSRKINSEAESQEVLTRLKDAKLTLSDITKKPSLRNPQAPFTTSTLQQTANSKLGFSSKQTMSIAQKLYQSGKITYMRTDSMNLSGQIIKACQNYIEQNFGGNYSKVRNFKTKSANAQEAHEAIRPTDINSEVASSNPSEQKLYSLIRNRTIASQMAPAELEKTTFSITLDNSKETLISNGEVIVFDGFLKVYGKDISDNELPNLSVGDNLDLISAQAKQTYKKPPARFTEGSLVKKLEELGIGRPSTYASIIDTVLTRGYAQKGEDEGEEQDIILIALENNNISKTIVKEKTGSNRGKLVPTAIGELISKFLYDYFNRVVDYGFTAEIETEFDEIARGELERNLMLKNFYEPFHDLVDKSGTIKRSDVSNMKEIGLDPKTNLPIFARIGRFGPMLQLGLGEEDVKPRFAPMPKGMTIESVTLDKALQAFKLPRLVGETRSKGLSKEGLPIKANTGRFGPYIQVDKKFISIKPHDPLDIELETAQELYEAKLQAESDKTIADFGAIKIINGHFGPYITDGSTNAKIDKKTKPENITEEQAEALLAKAKLKPKKAYKRRTKKSTK